MNEELNLNLFHTAGQNERARISILCRRLGLEYISMPSSCKYDALVSDGNETVAIIESKVRQFKHDKFDSTLIEKKKYDDLLNRYFQNECHKVLYVEFYSDQVARIFSLGKIQEPKWSKKDLNNTTMGSNDFYSKEVGYLDYELGKTIWLGGIDLDL